MTNVIVCLTFGWLAFALALIESGGSPLYATAAGSATYFTAYLVLYIMEVFE